MTGSVRSGWNLYQHSECGELINRQYFNGFVVMITPRLIAATPLLLCANGGGVIDET